MATFQEPVRSLSSVYMQGPATIVTNNAATLTLDPALHGGRMIYNNVATTTITLPVINAAANSVTSGPGQDPSTSNNLGPVFSLFIGTTATAVKIITGQGTDLFVGSISLEPATTVGGGALFVPTGSSISVNFNGTTTGGIAGSLVWFQPIAANKWLVQGTVIGSGTLATPFANS